MLCPCSAHTDLYKLDPEIAARRAQNLYLYTYIYISLYMCICICVSVRLKYVCFKKMYLENEMESLRCCCLCYTTHTRIVSHAVCILKILWRSHITNTCTLAYPKKKKRGGGSRTKPVDGVSLQSPNLKAA